MSIGEQRLKQREHEPREEATRITSEVEPLRRRTLLESAHDVGGISVFIFLFAKVCTCCFVRRLCFENLKPLKYQVSLASTAWREMRARQHSETPGHELILTF